MRCAPRSYLCPKPEARQYVYTQIERSLWNNGAQVHLGSDSKKPPRPRHRFSFSGQSEQPEGSSIPRAANVTRDDILNSLTKHAHPQEPEETALEMEEVAQFQGPNETAVEARARNRDRKSTRLNSSHVKISYAVFCLKKKK